MKRKIEANKKKVVKFQRIKKLDGKDHKILSAEEREKRKTSLYRAPTSEELTELRENESLYKNNLFRMQIQYLLEEVCLQEKKTKKLDEVLHSLNAFLKSIPAQDNEYDVADDKCLPIGVKCPFPNLVPRSKVKGKFQFMPPEEVKVVGSYLLKTLTKPCHCVDVAVELPKACLQARDHLNFRYHLKRATYLSWLASALKDWEHVAELQFCSDADIYKPTLHMKLKGKLGKKFEIRLLIAVPEDIFKLSRFSPLKNNVRSNWFENLESGTAEELDFPTPRYNASVLLDMLYESHLYILYSNLKECPAMKDAICLFKVWLKQRTFKGACSFNGFIGSMLMIYLLSTRHISAHMSSYQIFRLTLHFLATSDWTKNGISLCSDKGHQVQVEDFHSTYDVVFVDPSGYLNLCAEVDQITYEMVQYQAKLSVDVLDDSSVDGFDALFIKSHHFLQSVDHSFRLSKLEEFKKKLLQEESYKSSLIDLGGNWTCLVVKVVASVLQKGLDNRVKRIILKPNETKKWSITCPPENVEETSFWFGLYLDTEFSDNILIMGPPADQPEAKEFRTLWGSKSELRRFQDGSINEAVLWPCNNVAEKKLICHKIVNHMLSLHCNVLETSITYYASEFNSILKQKYITTNEKLKCVPGCGEEETTHLIKTYDELCKQIRALEGLPLKINSIDGIDPAFRLTDSITPYQFPAKSSHSTKAYLTPALGKKCPSWCPVYRVLIQFETSGKWPDHLPAIQHIKAAFHIKIADCLQNEARIPAVVTPTFIDVCKNGYVFRVIVVHYREMVLYTESNATGLLKKQHELSAKELDILIVKKPVHNTLIHSLNSQFHAYALTIRLAKRWVSSQMLFDYMGNEVVELIVASMFLSPAPMEAPRSHMCGFLRFLNVLSKYDWQNQPLIVNLNDQITSEDRIDIHETFTSNRSQLPPMFIATPYDRESSVWTKINPTEQILRRVSLLADTAIKLVENDCSLATVQQIFRPSMDDYDLVIELNRDFVPQHNIAIDSSLLSKPRSIKDSVNSTCLPVVDFDPPRIFLNELKEAFSEVALFFYDVYGGLTIGVVWKKSAYTAEPFKILNAQYKTVAEGSKPKKKKRNEGIDLQTLTVVPNLPAIISDLYIIGKGLVTNVRECK